MPNALRAWAVVHEHENVIAFLAYTKEQADATRAQLGRHVPGLMEPLRVVELLSTGLLDQAEKAGSGQGTGELADSNPATVPSSPSSEEIEGVVERDNLGRGWHSYLHIQVPDDWSPSTRVRISRLGAAELLSAPTEAEFEQALDEFRRAVETGGKVTTGWVIAARDALLDLWRSRG